MKKLIPILLLISLCTNLILFSRKHKRDAHDLELMSLFIFKDIPPAKGFLYFKTEVKKKYPSFFNEKKQMVIYRWDSLSYDFKYREQMKILDSLAARNCYSNCEYVFVTEMNENPSKVFLESAGDSYLHVKMLYNMDDFISGVCNIRKRETPTFKSQMAKKSIFYPYRNYPSALNLKGSLYLIIDQNNKVLYMNNDRCEILRDTAFFRSLKSISSKYAH